MSDWVFCVSAQKMHMQGVGGEIEMFSPIKGVLCFHMAMYSLRCSKDRFFHGLPYNVTQCGFTEKMS